MFLCTKEHQWQWLDGSDDDDGDVKLTVIFMCVCMWGCVCAWVCVYVCAYVCVCMCV